MKAPRDLPQPPRPLGEHGANLWFALQTEYEIDDAAGIEYLMQACQMLDLAERIAKSGRGSAKDELAARTMVVRTLARLGLSIEPLKACGGQPGPRRKGFGDDD